MKIGPFSLHGSNALSRGPKIHCFKFVIFCTITAALALAGRQIYAVVSRFVEEPTLVQVKIKNNEDFPVVTFCNLNPIRKSQAGAVAGLKELLSACGLSKPHNDRSTEDNLLDNKFCSEESEVQEVDEHVLKSTPAKPTAYNNVTNGSPSKQAYEIRNKRNLNSTFECNESWSLVGTQCYQMQNITAMQIDATNICLIKNATLPEFVTDFSMENYELIRNLTNISDIWLVWERHPNTVDWYIRPGPVLLSAGPWQTNHPVDSENCSFAGFATDPDGVGFWYSTICNTSMHVLCVQNGIEVHTITSHSSSTVTTTSSIVSNENSAISGLSSTLSPENTRSTVPDTVEEILTKAGIQKVITDQLATITTIRESIGLLVGSVDQSTRLAIGHQLGDSVVKCTFAGKDCDIDKDFKSFLHPDLGTCHSFNYDGRYKVGRAGTIGGLRLLLSAEPREYVCSSESLGYRLLVHQQDRFPFLGSNSYTVPTGYTASYSIQSESVHKRPTAKNRCVPDGQRPSEYSYDGQYTLEGCLDGCYQHSVQTHCGCADPHYALPMTSRVCGLDDKKCIDNIRHCSRVEFLQNCTCVEPCNVRYFEITGQIAPFRRNSKSGGGNSDVFIYFPESSEKHLIEIEGYSVRPENVPILVRNTICYRSTNLLVISAQISVA